MNLQQNFMHALGGVSNALLAMYSHVSVSTVLQTLCQMLYSIS